MIGLIVTLLFLVGIGAALYARAIDRGARNVDNEIRRQQGGDQ
jgi:hypothetical protein